MTEHKQTAGARQRIMETALRLFYAEGVRATGIDRIIAESGVAKMSFYRHFPSKADLVQAFLEERHRRWMAWFDAAVARKAGKRKPKLIAVADALAEWFAEPSFRGCAFINITSEFADAGPRAQEIVAAHKLELQQRLVTFARDDGIANPETTGRLALLIVDGAIVQARIWGAAKAVRDVRACLAGLSKAPRAPSAHQSA